MVGIKYISLDMDGTIVSRKYVDYFWLELVPRLYAERHGLDIETAKRVVFQSYDEVGQGDLRWYLPRYWFQRFGLMDELEYALSEAGKLVEIYEDALEFFEHVPNHVKLVLSTSAARDFIGLVFSRFPFLEKRFVKVFSSSSDFSLPGKPPEFFKAIQRELGIGPQEILHVGDDPESDYKNPSLAGLRAVLVSRDGKYDGIKSLNDVLHMIDFY
jgi:putative hydrolase of the HAD superfamily